MDRELKQRRRRVEKRKQIQRRRRERIKSLLQKIKERYARNRNREI